MNVCQIVILLSNFPIYYRLRRFFPDHNLIVASYDIVRNEIDFFSQIKWNYVILDEGHVIKNGKTKVMYEGLGFDCMFISCYEISS